MKKLTVFTYFFVLILFSFSLLVCADEGYYYDEVGLINDRQIIHLTNTLRDFEKKRDAKLMIVVVNTTGNKTPVGFAFDHLFNTVGNTGNGIILLLAINEGKVVIDTRGSASKALTDQRADILFDLILYEHFVSGDYYNGFLSFIDMCDGYFAISHNDHAYSSIDSEISDTGSSISSMDNETDDNSFLHLCLISLGIGIAAAIITVLILRGQLKSVKKAKNASVYVNHGSFLLTEKRDVFLYSTITKIPRPQSNSSKSRKY